MKILVVLVNIIMLSMSQPVNDDDETISECFNGKKYVHINRALTFSQANLACIVKNRDMVKVNSQDVFTFVNEFGLNAVNSDFWIGLTRDVNSEEDSPQSFTFRDGSVLEVGEFGGENGISPWRVGNPNGIDTLCVALVNEESLWQDENCSKSLRAICEESCEVEEDEVDLFGINIILIGGMVFIVVVLVISVVLLVRLNKSRNYFEHDGIGNFGPVVPIINDNLIEVNNNGKMTTVISGTFISPRSNSIE